MNRLSRTQPFSRLGLFTLGVAAILSVLLWRLVDVQLVRGSQFWEMAEQNRWIETPLVPARGVILDRFGQALVRNERYYTLLDNPEQLYSDGTVISQDQALPLLATESAQIRTLAQRVYPFGEALAHVVGYVGAITAEDVGQDRSLHAFGVIGKSGLELAFEQQLRGQLGRQRFEVDARVRQQRQFELTPAQAGLDIETSLDPYLSEVAYRALGSHNGVVVISDVQTGQVLSLVSKPAFDPNIFGQVMPWVDDDTRREATSQIQEWFTDESQPFFNRSVGGQYPPGSIFKLVTAMAGLETGAIDSQTTVLDEGILKVGEFEFANWYWTQYGRTEGDINLTRAIARSNDIFFYKAAEWIGPNRLAEMSRLFGLGQPVGVEIAGEKAGLVPDPAWKQAVVGEPWYLGNTYHYGIGQGDVKTTPLQLIQVIQAIGNQGAMCRPRLVQAQAVDCQELGIDQASNEAILEGMIEACSPGGTAFPFFSRNETALANAGVVVGVTGAGSQAQPEEFIHQGAVACKTGTAEFGGQNEQGYRNTHALWGGIVEPRIGLETEPDLEVSEQELALETQSDAQTVEGEESEVDQARSQPLDLLTFKPGTATLAELRQAWLAAQQRGDKSYPDRIAILVIAESDDDMPFKEGSREAAPVGAAIIDWMEGRMPELIDSE